MYNISDKTMIIYEKMLKFEYFVVIFIDKMAGLQINNNIDEKEVETFSNKSEAICIIYLMKLWKFIRKL